MGIDGRLKVLEKKLAPAELVTVAYDDDTQKQMCYEDAIITVLQSLDPFACGSTPIAPKPIYVDVTGERRNFIDAILGQAEAKEVIEDG